MIVNVNPYDTGFDENSQVMKFSAIAREVTTVLTRPAPEGRRRTVRLSMEDESYDALFDILEGERFCCFPNRDSKHIMMLAEIDPEEEEEGPINPLVDSLFDEIEQLRKRLHDSEERASRIEMEVREEVMKDMLTQMHVLEESYARRLRSAVSTPVIPEFIIHETSLKLENNEKKMDQKIDLLYRGGSFTGSECLRSNG